MTSSPSSSGKYRNFPSLRSPSAFSESIDSNDSSPIDPAMPPNTLQQRRDNMLSEDETYDNRYRI